MSENESEWNYLYTNSDGYRVFTRGSVNEMTRQQALRDYVDNAKLIDQLIEKQQNLEKIILAEVIQTPAIIRSAQMKIVRNSPGKTQERVIKALFDHGGELTTTEVATLTELGYMQVSPALHKLHHKHFVNQRIDKTGKTAKAYWSSAIKPDSNQ